MVNRRQLVAGLDPELLARLEQLEAAGWRLTHAKPGAPIPGSNATIGGAFSAEFYLSSQTPIHETRETLEQLVDSCEAQQQRLSKLAPSTVQVADGLDANDGTRTLA